MINLVEKQKQLLDLAHTLWDDPTTEFHISDSYWSLREADHEGKTDVQAYNELTSLCCRKLVLLQTRLRKAEKLMEHLL